MPGHLSCGPAWTAAWNETLGIESKGHPWVLLQIVSSMASKARSATVALHGQVNWRTASEQLSLLVLDLRASADGAWAALALHERVELFSLTSGKHHGNLPLFEV